LSQLCVNASRFVNSIGLSGEQFIWIYSVQWLVSTNLVDVILCSISALIFPDFTIDSTKLLLTNQFNVLNMLAIKVRPVKYDPSIKA
jgi:hypothetical protein